MDTNLLNPVKIGKYISEQRRTLGLTQEELGNRIYVTRKAVSKWEVGVSVPSLYKLKSLSVVLGVSIEDILQIPKEKTKTDSKAKIFDKLKLTIKNILINLFSILKTTKDETKKEKKGHSIFNININIGIKNKNINIYHFDSSIDHEKDEDED